MAVVRKVLCNPADRTKRYVLWSNGYIQNLGGALPINQSEASINSPPAPDAPVWHTSDSEPAVSFQILNWNTPSGWTLDCWGLIWPWGGAAGVAGAVAPLTGGPEYYFGSGGGFPAMPYGFVIDFMMDPANTGKGYFLQYNGDMIAFGTGGVLVAHSAYLTGVTTAVALQMDWVSKRYWILDGLGRIAGFNGGANPVVGGLTYPGYIWGRGGRTDFRLYDMSVNPKGWSLDDFGRAYEVGAAVVPAGYNFTPGARQWTGLSIIDDGTGVNPLRLLEVTQTGALNEWVVSTPPLVTVNEPIDPQTSVNRPWVRWAYTDREGNPEAKWELGIFTAAQYGIVGFDPAVSPATYRATGTDGAVQARSNIDLANATYRAYVRVTDTANMASAWANKQWTQTVTPLSVPTITPTVLGGLAGTSLLVHANTGAGLPGTARFGVQLSDDAGATWFNVINGDALVPDGSGNATVVDTTAPFGVVRSYRATTYIYSTTSDAWQASGWSATGNATLTPQNLWTLSNPLVPSQDTVIKQQPGFELIRTTVSTTVLPVNRNDPVVLSDGKPKLPTFDLSLWSLDKATRLKLEALVNSAQVLLVRDPFGRQWYVKVTGDFHQKMLLASPLATETTSIRDAHDTKIPVQTVKRPKAGPLVGPLAEV